MYEVLWGQATPFGGTGLTSEWAQLLLYGLLYMSVLMVVMVVVVVLLVVVPSTGCGTPVLYTGAALDEQDEPAATV